MDVSTLLFLYLMVERVFSQLDPCKRHSIIDDYRRDPDYTVRGSQRRLCDNLLVPGWYRFQINGTDADMPTTCAQVNGCGTLAPLWLSTPSGGLPLPGKQTTGNACATWKLPGRPRQCCGFRIKIQIRNCGEFFVYKLRNTGGCDLAYCAKVPNTFCPVGEIYVRHLQRCIEYKVGITKPSIDVVTVNRHVYINCTFNIPNNDVILPSTPTFHIIWYRLEGVTTFTIKSSFITSTYDALKLGEDVVPGDTVTCSVESLQGQDRKVSRPYFLGIKVLNESIVVQEDGDLYRLSYISTIPIVCNDIQTTKCKLDLVLKLRGKHQGHPEFSFSSCSLEFLGGDTCEDGICIEKIITLRMTPNLRNLLNDRLHLRGTIYVDESISWNQRFLSTKIQYTDLQSSVCFSLPGIQMLTFSDRKIHLRRRGTYVLLTSETNDLEIHIRVDICEDTQLCVCGIVIRYGDSFLSVDSCNSEVHDIENSRFGKYTSNFYKGRNGQMNIYEGRSGWLIYIMLEKRARIRLDFGQTGIVVAVLMSGYYNNKVSGLCGNMSSTTFPRRRFETDNERSIKWRIRPGSSYFERQFIPPEFIHESTEPTYCDCSTTNMNDQCPSPDRSNDLITLISLKEVTDGLIARTNNSYIPVYVFDGDYDSWPFVNESDAVVDKNVAGDQCLKLLLTSSITRSCNFYLDQYFETVLQICTELARYQHNSSWIAVTLRMLEGLCEIGIISHRNNSILNNTADINDIDIDDIREDVTCPENCHGNGVCTSGGCRCFAGFYGVECLKKAEFHVKPETTEAITRDDSTISSTERSTRTETTTKETQSSTYTESTTTSIHNEIKFVSCDVRQSSCSTVYLELDNSLNSFAVTCVVVPVQFSDTGWRPTETETNSTIRYINTDLVECMLPDKEYIDHDFRVFNVQVMDASWNRLSSMLYAVVDGDCQQCDKTNGCTIQNDTCFIDENCYEEFEFKPDDRCQHCKPDDDKWDWSPRSDNRSPMFDNGNAVYSIMENDTLVTQFSATDPDGDSIKYKINRQDVTMNRNGNFRWKPTIHVNTVNGSKETFIVTIYDECGLSTTLVVTVYVFKCDCRNNGTCPERIVSTNSSLDYDCDCQDSFIGRYCETTLNPCQYNPCYPGVSCTPNDSGSYTCGQCPNDLVGDGIKCVRGCRTNPCFPRTTCRNTVYPDYGYKCGNCPKYFYGNGIECNRTDENPCDLGVCSPLVRCNETNVYPGYTCGSCPKGYLGNGSSCTAICIPPCENGNVCISPGQCACNPQADCTDCRSNPCFPGVKCTNIKQYPGYKCEQCPTYFTGNGFNCTRNGESACRDKVCSPLVACKDVGIYPGYVCGACPAGYSGDGKNCNAECQPPCENGNICESPGNCICDPSENCTDCASNPCFHGVSCENIKQYPGFLCGSCPNFYNGDGVNCVRNDDSACVHDVCSRLVTCKDTKQYPGFMCSPCPEGYTGTGMNCKAQCIPPCDEDKVCVAPDRCECRAAYSRNCTTDKVTCASSPCFTGVPCKDISNQNPYFICGRCPRFFHGDGVECNRTADDACRARVCSSLVTCNNTNTYPGYTCSRCPPGYKGDGKICTAICDASCRFPRTCVSPGRCDCSPGFGGYNCRRPLCCPKCRNQGVCYWPNKCKCRTGYYGFRCEKAICNPPCGTGRFCKAPGVCSCPKGYTGFNCTVSLCNPPCQNGGRCVRPNVCACTKDFCGPRCELTKCRRKCEHGGICIAYNRCLCTMGYRGRFCQRPRCLQKCQNGGVCNSQGTCSCPYGYHGQFCQKASCNPGCYNGGICRRQNVCKCHTGYYGHLCQYAICRRQCYNGGRCVAPNKCSCRYGWGGRSCMRARCPFGCQNGGVCARPGVCICKRGFWGNYCQFAACWPRCMYGGVCLRAHMCLCRRHYSGTYCQITGS